MLNTIGSNARLGKGEFIVLEADESDRSFLLLSPTIAVVTNIEADHLDHYRDLDDIKTAFLSFINKVPFYGAAILCLDDPAVQSLIPGITGGSSPTGLPPRPTFRFPTSAPKVSVQLFIVAVQRARTAGVQAQRARYAQRAECHGGVRSGADMGVEAPVIAGALESFQGVERRFQVKSRDGITVIDDYAHHPTEIRATLSAAKCGNFRRLFAVFQPHRYTRTFHLFDDFARAFNLADVVLMLDIYPAGENADRRNHTHRR